MDLDSDHVPLVKGAAKDSWLPPKFFNVLPSQHRIIENWIAWRQGNYGWHFHLTQRLAADIVSINENLRNKTATDIDKERSGMFAALLLTQDANEYLETLSAFVESKPEGLGNLPVHPDLLLPFTLKRQHALYDKMISNLKLQSGGKLRAPMRKAASKMAIAKQKVPYKTEKVMRRQAHRILVGRYLEENHGHQLTTSSNRPRKADLTHAMRALDKQQVKAVNKATSTDSMSLERVAEIVSIVTPGSGIVKGKKVPRIPLKGAGAKVKQQGGEGKGKRAKTRKRAKQKQGSVGTQMAATMSAAREVAIKEDPETLQKGLAKAFSGLTMVLRPRPGRG